MTALEILVRGKVFAFRIACDVGAGRELREETVAYVECPTPALAMARGLANSTSSIVRLYEIRRDRELLCVVFNDAMTGKKEFAVAPEWQREGSS